MVVKQFWMSSEVISMDGVYAENCLEQFQYNQTYIRPSISNRVVVCKACCHHRSSAHPVFRQAFYSIWMLAYRTSPVADKYFLLTAVESFNR